MIRVSMLVRAVRCPGLWRVWRVDAATATLLPRDADAALFLWSNGATHYLMEQTSQLVPAGMGGRRIR